MQRRQALSTVCKLVGSSALAAWGAAAQAQSEGVSDNRIVLGQSAPFSGAAVQLGLQFNLGAQLHFDALNARGGVNGRRIEIARLDDSYDPERCAANTRQFIQDGVFALFGYVGTPTSLVALPPHLDFVQGAALPIAATTAWNAVRSASVRPGSVVVLLGTAKDASRIRRAKASGETTSTAMDDSAVASCVRGAPSISVISPNQLPGSSTARMASRPSPRSVDDLIVPAARP